MIGDGTAQRFDIRATDVSGKQLVLTFNDSEPFGTNISHLGDILYVDWKENTIRNLLTIGMLVNTDQSFFITTLDGKQSGYSMVTRFDLPNKRISGVFDFELIDPTNNETFRVTEGVYTNVTYTAMAVPE